MTSVDKRVDALEASVTILRAALVKAEEKLQQEKEDGEVAIIETHRRYAPNKAHRQGWTQVIDQLRSGNHFPEAAGVGTEARKQLDEAIERELELARKVWRGSKAHHTFASSTAK